MPDSPVSNDELLFRRVPNKPENLKSENGICTVGASAFNSPDRRPSVNRARFLPDPRDTQMDPSDGVLSLLAIEIREIGSVALEPPAVGHFKVLVEPRPIYANNREGEPENLSHAQIETDPPMDSPSRFRKLKEALARLANRRPWLIEPK
jgi:hypothetical protein